MHLIPARDWSLQLDLNLPSLISSTDPTLPNTRFQTVMIPAKNIVIWIGWVSRGLLLSALPAAATSLKNLCFSCVLSATELALLIFSSGLSFICPAYSPYPLCYNTVAEIDVLLITILSSDDRFPSDFYPSCQFHPEFPETMNCWLHCTWFLSFPLVSKVLWVWYTIRDSASLMISALINLILHVK